MLRTLMHHSKSSKLNLALKQWLILVTLFHLGSLSKIFCWKKSSCKQTHASNFKQIFVNYIKCLPPKQISWPLHVDKILYHSRLFWIFTVHNAFFQACVYLFSGLSIHLWHPTYKNMDYMISWLLKADLSSPEHQLARYIVSNLNWGHVGEV